MEEEGVLYGGSLSYRFMCRYNSGFFFRHPLALPYKYYWRVEPGVHFPCMLQYDPFKKMVLYKKKYSFFITHVEISETIPTLWNTTQSFARWYGADKGHLDLFKNRSGDFNGCHYWSNIEIADMDFFRSKDYLAYFDYLDGAGGFFCALHARSSDEDMWY
jgi:alpha 1,2-mannosyltransferase